MNNKQLDFVIAGVQKGGTTSLADQLSTHPHIAFCQEKEPHFFSKSPDCDDPESQQAYWSLFEEKSSHTMLYGEASTSYTFVDEYPETAQRLYRHNPDLKVIILLRHPVKRVISHIYHRMRKGLVPHGDIMASLHDNADYIQRSCYFAQLKAYFDVFPAEQIKIMRFDHIHADDKSALCDVGQFLGLDTDLFPEVNCDAKNISDARMRLQGVPMATPVLAWLSSQPWAWRLTPYIPMKTPLPNDLSRHIAQAVIDDLEALAGSGWVCVDDWLEDVRALAKRHETKEKTA